MKKGITLLIILLMGISFTSCEKKDDKEPEVNKEELIQAHIWKGNEVKTYVDDVESGTLSITDYEFTFDANKDYSITRNGTVEFSGTWQYIKGDPDVLKTTDSNNNVKEYSIDKITNDVFEITIATDVNTKYKYFLVK